MQNKSSNFATSNPLSEDQTIYGLVSELERQIGNSMQGSGVRTATLTAKRPWHFEALRRKLGNSRAKTAGLAENRHGFLSIIHVHKIQAVEISVPPVTKFFDEINFAGEMVGFGIGILVRLTILSTATILVVGFFSIFVFLFAVGRGLMKKRWDSSPS